MSHLMAGVVPLGYRAPEASHLPPLPVQLFLAYQHLSAALLAANPVSIPDIVVITSLQTSEYGNSDDMAIKALMQQHRLTYDNI